MTRKFTNDYHEFHIERLKDNELAVAYLNTAVEEGDPHMLLVALRNVAEAHGGMSRVARIANLNRANLYKMLSKKGRPEIQSLSKVLDAMGFCLQIAQKPRGKTKTKLKKAA